MVEEEPLGGRSAAAPGTAGQVVIAVRLKAPYEHAAMRDVRGLPSASVACVAVTPGQENGLRGGLPSPALPGSGPWGRRSAVAVRPLSLPVATPVTRRLVRSSSLDHLADDGQTARRRGRAPRAESPGMPGPDVLAPANSSRSGQRQKPAAAVSGLSRIGFRHARPSSPPMECRDWARPAHSAATARRLRPEASRARRPAANWQPKALLTQEWRSASRTARSRRSGPADRRDLRPGPRFAWPAAGLRPAFAVCA